MTLSILVLSSQLYITNKFNKILIYLIEITITRMHLVHPIVFFDLITRSTPLCQLMDYIPSIPKPYNPL